MLAVSAPGTHSDVAPSWMLEEATSHSKMEYQRGERVHKTSAGRTSESSFPRGGGGGFGGKGGGRAKGGGQGGGRKGGGAKGAGPRTQG